MRISFLIFLPEIFRCSTPNFLSHHNFPFHPRKWTTGPQNSTNHRVRAPPAPSPPPPVRTRAQSLSVVLRVHRAGSNREIYTGGGPSWPSRPKEAACRSLSPHPRGGQTPTCKAPLVPGADFVHTPRTLLLAHQEAPSCFLSGLPAFYRYQT